MNKPDPKFIYKLLKYTSIPFEFFILIGGSAWVGSWLDKKFNIQNHLLTVFFAIFGFIIGIYHIFKSFKNDKFL